MKKCERQWEGIDLDKPTDSVAMNLVMELSFVVKGSIEEDNLLDLRQKCNILPRTFFFNRTCSWMIVDSCIRNSFYKWLKFASLDSQSELVNSFSPITSENILCHIRKDLIDIRNILYVPFPMSTWKQLLNESVVTKLKSCGFYSHVEIVSDVLNNICLVNSLETDILLATLRSTNKYATIVANTIGCVWTIDLMCQRCLTKGIENNKQSLTDKIVQFILQESNVENIFDPNSIEFSTALSIFILKEVNLLVDPLIQDGYLENIDLLTKMVNLHSIKGD